MIHIDQDDTGNQKLVASHWLRFFTPEKQHVIQVSGIAMVQFMVTNSNWVLDTLHICRNNPYMERRPSTTPGKYSLLFFRPVSWSVFAAPAGLDFTMPPQLPQVTGWHIDNFSIPSAGQEFAYNLPEIEVKFAVRNTPPGTAHMWSLSYQATFVCETFWRDEADIN